MRPTVVLDTNALFGDLLLNGIDSKRLRDLSSAGLVRVVLPEVVLQEAARKWEQNAAKALKELYKSRDTVARFMHDVQKESRDLPTLHSKTVKAERGRYTQHMQIELEMDGVELHSSHRFTVEDLVQRDLAHTRPFDVNGRGMRDAVIWASVLDLTEEGGGSDEAVYFVTDDGDFQKDGELHEDLADELADSSRVVVVESIAALMKDRLVDQLAELAVVEAAAIEQLEGEIPQATPDELMAEAATGKATDLVGYTVAHLDENPQDGEYDFSSLELPRGPESYEIASVMADARTAEVQVYDRLEGDTLLAQVLVDAEIEFYAYIYRGDWYVLDEDTELVVEDADWNDHYVLATVTRECTLGFQVRIDGESVDYVEFEFAVPYRELP